MTHRECLSLEGDRNIDDLSLHPIEGEKRHQPELLKTLQRSLCFSKDLSALVTHVFINTRFSDNGLMFFD